MSAATTVSTVRTPQLSLIDARSIPAQEIIQGRYVSDLLGPEKKSTPR